MYISIIIPAFNEERYIKKTVESVHRQNFKDYETIVVANGCTDTTEQIVKQFSNVRCLSLPQPNVSVARNIGALAATGEILLFLDADTQLHPDSLKAINTTFTQEYAVATTRSYPDTPLWRYKIVLAFKNWYNASALYQGCSGALICRKKDFHAVGGYQPDLSVREHRKLTLALRKQGKYLFIDTPTTTSMRRYHRWGIGKAVVFWTQQWINDKRGKLQKTKYEVVR